MTAEQFASIRPTAFENTQPRSTTRRCRRETDPGFELEYVDIGNVDSSGQIRRPPYRFEGSPGRKPTQGPRRRCHHLDGSHLSPGHRADQSPAGQPDCFERLRRRAPFARSLTRVSASSLWEPEFLAEVERRSVGVSYPAVNASDLGDIEIPVPPLPQQRAIAAFHWTGRRRGWTRWWRRRGLLELLAEKRRALGTRAVTRGCSVSTLRV